MPSIPVISTGRNEAMSKAAAEHLKPEVEGPSSPPIQTLAYSADRIAVVHFVCLEAIEQELPLLLLGQVPAEPSSSIGSGDWSRAPQAVLFGNGYNADDLIRLRQLVAASPDGRQIPWIHLDKTRATVATPGSDEYAGEVASRAKEALQRLGDEGKLGDGNGQLVPA